ncbi:uncharacterized protein LOC135256012 [Anguilla rostrata]|uniref:uncharacterized protein LOC135256012 n=1 Tax=Anguilla rostrata TaxID=7938 RepID=UPI0030D4B557
MREFPRVIVGNGQLSARCLLQPSARPQSSLTADDFATFFDEKIAVIRNSFCTPPHPMLPSPCLSTPLLTVTGSQLPTPQPVLSPSLTISPCFSDFSPLTDSETTLDPSIIGNYRPVSLLPFLSKTIERAASNQLSVFLSQNELLDPHQSGFRPGHSTETALLSVNEALHAARAASLSSVLLLLDLSAAFDTVDHPTLLSSLSAMGICGTVLNWIESYLSDRSFQVSARITACLSDIQSWMVRHHLKLNPGKTELIYIPALNSPLSDLSISLGNTILTPSPSTRNLGVVMSLTEHISAVTRSCRFFLYNIRRIHPFLTTYSTQLLVQAVVLSRLDYCNSLLAGLPASSIRPLQLIQNAAARLVFNLPRHSHVTPLLTTLHWLPVMARIKFKTLVLAFKAARGSAPPYLRQLIRPYTPARPLRSAATCRLVPAPARTSTRSRLLSVLAPRWWNDLPVQVRTAETLAVFKRRLKTHLFKLHLTSSPPTTL